MKRLLALSPLCKSSVPWRRTSVQPSMQTESALQQIRRASAKKAMAFCFAPGHRALSCNDYSNGCFKSRELMKYCEGAKMHKHLEWSSTNDAL